MSERNGHATTDEWATLAEVAKQLGIHERQARRYAGRLADTDRTPPGHSPIRVRVSAISVQMDRTVRTAVRLESGPDRTEERPDTTDTVRPPLSQQLAVVYEALIRTEREKYDAVVQAKDVLIEEKAARIRLLETTTEELRQQLALAAAPVETQAGLVQPHTSEATALSPSREQRPWWQFWKGR
jgi:hypothetical protein